MNSTLQTSISKSNRRKSSSLLAGEISDPRDVPDQPPRTWHCVIAGVKPLKRGALIDFGVLAPQRHVDEMSVGMIVGTRQLARVCAAVGVATHDLQETVGRQLIIRVELNFLGRPLLRNAWHVDSIKAFTAPKDKAALGILPPEQRRL